MSIGNHRAIAWGCMLCALALFVARPAAAQLRGGRSSSVVNIEGTQYYVHAVRKGETLYSLSKLYDVAQNDIIENNPQAAEGLREDQVLKIPVTDFPKPMSERQMARKFETHTVQRGETAYSISKRYGISAATLLEDNPCIDPALLSLGQQLNIRKGSMGGKSDAQIDRQWDEYTQALNSVSDDAVYHRVLPGETVYSLSRKYGVAQNDIVQANKIETAGLKAGSLIRIPVPADTTQAPVATETAPQDQPEDKASEVFDDLFGFGPGKGEPRKFEGGQMNVALMLPLQGTATGKNFLEFYQGALIALQDLKGQGLNVQLNLYDTEKSADKVEEQVASYPFQSTDMIIGPIYEESLPPVLQFAEEHRVAVVSPLAQTGDANCPLLYQLSPDPDTKYDKLRSVLSPDKNVVVISGAVNDSEFEAEIAPLLPDNCKRFSYSKGVSSAALDGLVRGDKENVLVVLAQDEYSVDGVMARVSSVRNNLVARGVKTGPITVVGSSRWQRFVNVDRNLFFKLNVCLVTNYHANRSNPVVMAFNKRYIAAFGALPSLYSYRGYDAVKLFAGTCAKRGDEIFETAVNHSSQQLLQMPYRFTQKTRTATHVNREWALVCYRSDYTIEVK